MKQGAVIGLVIGSVLLLGTIITVAVVSSKKKAKKKAKRVPKKTVQAAPVKQKGQGWKDALSVIKTGAELYSSTKKKA